MKVAVIPDAAMIVVPLIEKNGHEYGCFRWKM